MLCCSSVSQVAAAAAQVPATEKHLSEGRHNIVYTTGGDDACGDGDD